MFNMHKSQFLKVAYFLTIIITMIALPIKSFANPIPLKPEKAFVLSVSVTAKNSLRLNWDIAPGYFLYTNRMKVTSESIDLDVKMPDSTGLKQSPDGDIEPVYSQDLVIPVVLLSNNIPETLKIIVGYQGCAQNGFCYPPMNKLIAINMRTQTVTYQDVHQLMQRGVSLNLLLTDHNKIKLIFSTEHFAFTLLIFFVLGILLAFTPCVLPMLPILTGIILGEKKLVSTRRAFLLSFLYVLGVAFAYACAGIIASLMGNSIQVWMQQPIFIIGLAIFLVFLALSLFEFLDLPISRRWQNIAMKWSARHQGGTYVGVFLMGVFSTLIVSPCVTAPMIGVLLYIAQTGNLVLGASALFVMGLGMGVPLIIVGMSAGKFLPKSGPWMRVIVKLFGLILLAMAVWLISRLLSSAVTVFVWGVYLVGLAVFMYIVMPDLIRHRVFNRTIGLIIGLMGMLLILNSLGVTQYIDKWTGSSSTEVHEERSFIKVHTADQLQDELKKAVALNQPALVDFYADWCEACVSMERNVFALDSTQKLLKDFVLIRVDLTENTNDDQTLMKKYDVIAPPTILLFTKHGKEALSHRIIGELNANEFSNRINAFLAIS